LEQDFEQLRTPRIHEADLDEWARIAGADQLTDVPRTQGGSFDAPSFVPFSRLAHAMELPLESVLMVRPRRHLRRRGFDASA
jgi:hypothetical protein